MQTLIPQLQALRQKYNALLLQAKRNPPPACTITAVRHDGVSGTQTTLPEPRPDTPSPQTSAMGSQEDSPPVAVCCVPDPIHQAPSSSTSKFSPVPESPSGAVDLAPDQLDFSDLIYEALEAAPDHGTTSGTALLNSNRGSFEQFHHLACSDGDADMMHGPFGSQAMHAKLQPLFARERYADEPSPALGVPVEAAGHHQQHYVPHRRSTPAQLHVLQPYGSRPLQHTMLDRAHSAPLSAECLAAGYARIAGQHTGPPHPHTSERSFLQHQSAGMVPVAVPPMQHYQPPLPHNSFDMLMDHGYEDVADGSYFVAAPATALRHNVSGGERLSSIEHSGYEHVQRMGYRAPVEMLPSGSHRMRGEGHCYPSDALHALATQLHCGLIAANQLCNISNDSCVHLPHSADDEFPPMCHRHPHLWQEYHEEHSMHAARHAPPPRWRHNQLSAPVQNMASRPDPIWQARASGMCLYIDVNVDSDVL